MASTIKAEVWHGAWWQRSQEKHQSNAEPGHSRSEQWDNKINPGRPRQASAPKRFIEVGRPPRSILHKTIEGSLTKLQNPCPKIEGRRVPESRTAHKHERSKKAVHKDISQTYNQRKAKKLK